MQLLPQNLVELACKPAIGAGKVGLEHKCVQTAGSCYNTWSSSSIATRQACKQWCISIPTSNWRTSTLNVRDTRA